MIWNVTRRNVWSDVVSRQKRRLNNSTKYLLHAPPLQEEMKSVGELSQVCSQNVLNCSYFARIGRRDILWLVNKLARSIAKWTKGYHKRLNRLKHCKTMQVGTVSRLLFCGRSWGLKNPLLEEHCAFLEVIHKLDVQETNFSFTQFNRIRNHLFGRWIEIGRDSWSRFMGSDCFCPWQHDSDSWKTGETRCQFQLSLLRQEFQLL